MIDPTIEFVEVELEGKTYQMCFDLGSMAHAEASLNKGGADISVLRGIDFAALTLERLLVLFACSLLRAQPDLRYEDALALGKRQTQKMLKTICECVLKAWAGSMGTDEEPEKNAVATTGASSPSAASSTGSTCGALPDSTQS